MCAGQEGAAAAEGFEHCVGCKLSFTIRFYQAVRSQPDGLSPLCRGCIYEVPPKQTKVHARHKYLETLIDLE